jgi:hypothetical protein
MANSWTLPVGTAEVRPSLQLPTSALPGWLTAGALPVGTGEVRASLQLPTSALPGWLTAGLYLLELEKFGPASSCQFVLCQDS